MIGIATALIASGYNNIMDYIQLLFSFFNAPLFATFIIGMFWKRMTPWAGFWGLLAGTLGAAIAHYGNDWGWFDLGSAQAAAFWGAIAAFVLDAIVSVARHVRHEAEAGRGAAAASSTAWPRRRGRAPPPNASGTGGPHTLAAGALGLTAILSFIFA